MAEGLMNHTRTPPNISSRPSMPFAVIPVRKASRRRPFAVIGQDASGDRRNLRRDACFASVRRHVGRFARLGSRPTSVENQSEQKTADRYNDHLALEPPGAF